MMKYALLIFAILLAAFWLPGCEVGQNYQPPQVQVLQDWGEQGREPTTRFATQSSRTVSRSIPIVEWWTTFHDPILDDLIDRAAEQNFSLKQATSRVREARAQRGVVGSALFPQVNASGQYQHARVSENGVASAFGSGGNGTVNAGGGQPAPGANGSPAIPGSALGEFDLYQAGFDSTWEIDIFGGQRRAIEAANADIQSAVEDRRDVLLSLLGEVARNYIELRQTQARLDIAHKNLEAQNQTAALTREQVRQGLSNELNLSRAQAQVATTEAQIPALEVLISQAIHRLSVLLGDRPTALAQELSALEPLPPIPQEVPVGLPSELLRRRPDVRRAERQIAAATARVGVATADLFPRFTLNASAGLQSLQPAEFFDWQSRFYSIGPGISWPLFDAGQIKSRIHVTEARQEQAILAYRQTVLTALKDVEDALVAYNKAQERVISLRTAAAQEAKAVRIARDLYSRGLADFLTVLDAERSLYAAEDALAAGQGDVATSLVTLYKALGGGWQADELRNMVR